MPKTEIDYSNTIIYKITCKDATINDVYVGHTTNFVQRKHAHKQSCINIKSSNYKCKVYEAIRNNGGWDNWTMEIINFFNCLDHYEARQKEQEYFVLLNATLNSIEPMPKPKFDFKNGTEKTMLTPITSNYTMISNDFTHKTPIKFVCENCDFATCNKKDFNRHIQTKKHINNVYQCVSIGKPQKTPYQCICGKIYKDNSGLWRHKKTCNNFDKPEETNKIKDELHIPNETMEIIALFKEQINENKELRKILIEQNKQLHETNNKLLLIAKERGPINNSNNTNISNNNNKTFNLQVYLNETCKDAINLTDFVDSIKVQIKDLVNVGEKGYAEGISDIFINNLQQLNTHSRPIHCSDSKRETIYIKDAEQWTKDDEEKTTLTKAIKQVANKNIKQISEWQKLHPKYKDPDSKQNDKYMKIVLNSMSGSTNEEANKNYEKIIKNVIKETVIDKCN